MKKLFCVAVCMIMMLNSCFHENSKIPVIDVDSPTGSVDLKLSDLLSDIRMIRLETRDDVLLTTREAYRFSDKYIVCYSSSGMHLFDKDGKYLRLLTRAGGGPNEFGRISNAFIDDENDILYYTDARNRATLYLYRIDLASGNFLSPIDKTQDKSDFLMSDMDKNGNIYGFFRMESLSFLSGSSKKDTSSCYIAYKYNISKDTIEGIEIPGSYISSGFNRSISKHKDDIYIYDSSYGDTLFYYAKNKLSSVIIIKMKDIMTDIQAGGNTLNIELAYKDGFLFKHSHSKIDIRTGTSGQIESISVMNPTKNYFLVDKNRGKLSVIKNFYIDPIGASINIAQAIDPEQHDSQLLNINEFIKKSGNYGFCMIEAFKMETLIDEALAGDKLSDAEKETLRKFRATINEDDNPVVIVGKIL